MSPVKGDNKLNKQYVTISYDAGYLENDATPTKRGQSIESSNNFLQAKKAISFSVNISRESSADSFIEEKKQKELFFPVEKVKFSELYDWANHKEEDPQPSRGQKPKTGAIVSCNRKKIALFRYAQEVFAIDENCPHLGGPLHLGDIETLGEANILCVVCPWHKWRLELCSGKLKMPSGRGIRNEVYPTRVLVDGTIHVGFAEIASEYFNGDEDF